MSEEVPSCPNCGALAKGDPRATVLTCHYCNASYPNPLARVVASSPPPGGGATESPLAARGRDPLGGLVIKGIWSSIQTGHCLTYLSERDRLLDFESESGRFHIWAYNRTLSHGDPLPACVANGQWGSIQGDHELISLGGDHLLDWEPGSGAYRIWSYDRNASGSQDVLPSVLTKGVWSSIRSSKRLVYVGGDRLLEWEPSSGAFRIWHYERNAGGRDPLPGGPVVEGRWSSIRDGHELVYLGSDLLLDWVPSAGNFRLWALDRGARGSGDPIPTELAAGNWSSIRAGHQLINLEGDRVLDWEPASGAYRIWALQR